jgi:nitroreductase
MVEPRGVGCDMTKVHMNSRVPPALGLSETSMEAVLRAAGRAPSLHNVQPWRFRVEPDVIELHADPARRLPATDPDDRELRLSCGAALFNLRVALQAAGVQPKVTSLPATHGGTRLDLNPGPLAEIRRAGTAVPSAQVDRMMEAITSRRTNRRPFLDAAVLDADRARLTGAVDVVGGRLVQLTDPKQREAVRRLMLQAHRVQRADPAIRAEFAAWIGRERSSADGVPAATAGLTPEEGDEWVLRDFGQGTGPRRQPGKDYERDPLVVVVCSYYDGSLAELQAGEALQSLLLTATTLGLASSFMSQIIEVPQARAEMRQILGPGLVPQAIIRLGYGSPVAASRRRPVSELLLTAAAGTSA